MLSQIWYDPNPSDATFTYTYYGLDRDENFDYTVPVANPEYTFLNSQGVPYIFSYGLVQTSYAPHSNVRPALKAASSSADFMWLQAGESISMGVAGGDEEAGKVFTVRAFRFEPDGLHTDFSVDITLDENGDGTVSKTVSTNGYYCYFMFLSDSANLRITLSTTYNGGVWCHFPAKEAYQLALQGATIGIHGESIFVSNTSNTTVKNGNAIGVQISSGHHWMEYLFHDNTDHFDDIAKLDGAVSLNFDNGIYMYRRPADQDDLRLQEYCKLNAAGALLQLTARLDSKFEFLLVYISTNGDPTNQTGRFTFAQNFEFRSKSQLFNYLPASMKTTSFLDEIQGLAALGQVHSNESHIANITRTISNIANAVESVGSLFA
jgi:hypothetical protein